MPILFNILALLSGAISLYTVFVNDNMVEGLLWMCLASLSTLHAKVK